MRGGCPGSGAASSAGPSEDGGGGEWRRIYDRIEALLPRVAELAADRVRLEEITRTQRELSEARENRLRARLLQAEASRTRWKTAYIELPLLANPKIIDLQENDLKDYGTCEDDDNLQLVVQPKEARSSVELRQNSEDHDGIAGDLRAELRKLKQAYEALNSNKDKEIYGLNGVKDFLWDQLRTIDKENMALFRIKEVEAAQATEATQKLQQSLEALQVASRNNKDDKVGRLQAEAVNAKQRVPNFDGKLLEIISLVREKNDEIQNLRNEAAQKRMKTAYEIFVKILNGKTITLEVKGSDTIYDIKAKIQDKEGIPAGQQRLIFEDKLLVCWCTLEGNYIREESTLTLHLVRQGMHIFVMMLSGKIMTFEVQRVDTVHSVKAKIFDETGFLPAQQRLMFAGKQLDEERTLADYDIQSDSTLFFVLAFLRDRTRISVRTLAGKTIIERFASRSETVGCLKAKIHVEFCIPPEQQCLSWNGKLLESDRVLTEIRYECQLVLQLRLPGGQ